MDHEHSARRNPELPDQESRLCVGDRHHGIGVAREMSAQCLEEADLQVLGGPASRKGKKWNACSARCRQTDHSGTVAVRAQQIDVLMHKVRGEAVYLDLAPGTRGGQREGALPELRSRLEQLIPEAELDEAPYDALHTHRGHRSRMPEDLALWTSEEVACYKMEHSDWHRLSWWRWHHRRGVLTQSALR